VLKNTFGGGASQITDDLQLSTSLALPFLHFDFGSNDSFDRTPFVDDVC